ncbi:hypothetical protein M9H77_31114 [Catharanthus roseus]|uniref:Uncharacterized protein n=1 Tax=Catharanthus roseus TaxID=4058 RepID=A0ACC0A1T8_CATRO|nr:hypothetical protein M9H77_31114 [Catharanthus roseus]
MVTFLLMLDLMSIILMIAMRAIEHNDISCKRVPRNDVRYGGNYVNMDERFYKRKSDYEGYYDSYNYGGYNCGRSSQTLGITLMQNNQWGYGNISPHARYYEHNSYDCFPGNDVRYGRNYVNMDESYNYGGYNYGRSSQTLGTTLRPLSYNNLKLPIFCGTFGPYGYEVWEQKVESFSTPIV